MELELLQQTAQRLGIAPSHYDIDGRLIYASPETLLHFVELLKPVENKCRREEFNDVLACFENEPINYDVERIALTEPIISLELLDENSTSITQKITQNSTALSLPPLSFGYYQLLLSTKSHHYSIRLPVLLKNVSTVLKKINLCSAFSLCWLKFLYLNIPSLSGILYEYPNWRKKLTQFLELMFNNESLKTCFAMLKTGRKV
ncbi:hypothetical protein E5343_05525 [Rodentibacter caecimuris]|uniref:hypothetical protein n=1 Tax=Rodentibacter caecimuris TaxID=1796644 RepID=UPI001094D6D3|nr:hypothetical protein [Pasteurella caecimuris]TGY49880.1 hypothetical protein E5343_05525 [Pasteurella caecimuris]